MLKAFWTDGERHLPCDLQIYDKSNDGKTKNDYFGILIYTAKERRFQPAYVFFDDFLLTVIWFTFCDFLVCMSYSIIKR